MPIIEPAIRPPAEADSFLLQLTTGCSSNQCTFCGAYKGKPFRIKEEAEIIQDIEVGVHYDPAQRRVFLMDGDALVIPNQRLIPILKKLNNAFPRLTRIASYANGYNIGRRSMEELAELATHKLKLIYIGLESGNQQILEDCRKGSSVSEMIEAAEKAASAGIKISVMVLLGLGGQKNSVAHVQDTIRALNRIQPRYLSFLSLMLIPGTPLYRSAQKGDFKELNPSELLIEERSIIAGLTMNGTVFRSDHASNYLALEGRLPADKTKLLTIIDAAISGHGHLKPERCREL
ncbi:MAG TPA: radical SAM protein [Firmicutes bacterium]|nr:radical SAM protein [Bacillota bacterium]